VQTKAERFVNYWADGRRDVVQGAYMMLTRDCWGEPSRRAHLTAGIQASRGISVRSSIAKRPSPASTTSSTARRHDDFVKDKKSRTAAHMGCLNNSARRWDPESKPVKGSESS